MKKFIGFIIVLVVIAVALVFTRPSKADFQDYLVKTTQSRSGSKAVDAIANSILKTGIKSELMGSTIKYQNKIIFAEVEVNKSRFLGIARMWIPLK